MFSAVIPSQVKNICGPKELGVSVCALWGSEGPGEITALERGRADLASDVSLLGPFSLQGALGPCWVQWKKLTRR